MFKKLKVVVQGIEHSFSIDEVLLEDVSKLLNRFKDRAIGLECGRNRVVLFMPHSYVIKLPVTLGGTGDNDWEGSVRSSSNQDCVQYARTRLAYVEELPIVFMETVTPATSAETVDKLGTEPTQYGSVDCGQVGFNRKGKLVAYDYGYN